MMKMVQLAKTDKLQLNVLLIEDNQDDAYLTDMAFKESNINASMLVANNGKLGIQILESIVNNNSALPDLILLDINLPRVNGLEILKFIKSHQMLSSIPTVVFTSSDSLGDMAACYENGANLFIRKPNKIDDFKETIQYIVNYCLEA